MCHLRCTAAAGCGHVYRLCRTRQRVREQARVWLPCACTKERVFRGARGSVCVWHATYIPLGDTHTVTEQDLRLQGPTQASMYPINDVQRAQAVIINLRKQKKTGQIADE